MSVANSNNDLNFGNNKKENEKKYDIQFSVLVFLSRMADSQPDV